MFETTGKFEKQTNLIYARVFDSDGRVDQKLVCL